MKIWQRSAPRRAARATAVVSEPPRPRVVVSAALRVGLADPLEAGHDHDPAGGQLLANPARIDVGDPGPAVAAVGGDPGLGAGQADRRHAERVEGHRHEGRALVLAGRQEHVQLARIGVVGDRGGQGQELVGRVAHRRDHDDQVRAGVALAGDPPGDAPDPIGRRRPTSRRTSGRRAARRACGNCGLGVADARIRVPTSDRF